MNAVPPTMTPGKAGRRDFGPGAAAASSRKWAALQEAANVVAMLAGFEHERPGAEVRNFPALMRDTAKWRRELAEQQIDDMNAMMQPGIAALLGVNARGADPRPAALALWREYIAARAAVLALLPPSGDMGPRRSA